MIRLRTFLIGGILLCPGALAAGEQIDFSELVEQVQGLHKREAAVRERRAAEFLARKDRQQRLLKDIRKRLAAEKARAESLKRRFSGNEEEIRKLTQALQDKVGNLGELFGTVRQVAGDFQAHARESLVSAQYPQRSAWLDRLARSSRLPDVNELEKFWLLLQQEIQESGRVFSFPFEVVGADGTSRQRRVTRIGLFTAVSGGRYLQFQPESGKLVELSRQPPDADQETAAALERAAGGMTEAVIDPSRGSLLGLLVQTPTLMERIRQGGLIGYIILALGALGLVIVLFRLAWLGLVGLRVRAQIRSPETPRENNPLGRVLAVAAANPDEALDELEMQLDEAIVREMPGLTRGQALIKLLAGVAPLLGLLGTVTGMILTFQSISLFGTGDPRLMADGISQALITTVLGLVVAVPLLFMHTLISTRSKALVQILDEQTAGLLVTLRQSRPGR